MKYPRLLCLLLFLSFSPLLLAAEREIAAAVSDIVGDVRDIAPDGSRRPLKIGDKVYRGDRVQTLTGVVELHFSDGGLIRLGRFSTFRVDEYRHPGLDDDTGKAFFTLLQGGLRAISGMIGKEFSEDYRIDTVIAAAGLRGTVFRLHLCQGGDCAPLANGLYSGVTEGTIFLENEMGALDVALGQASFTATANTIPHLIPKFPLPLIEWDKPAGSRPAQPPQGGGYNPLNDPGMGGPTNVNTGRIDALIQTFQSGSAGTVAPPATGIPATPIPQDYTQSPVDTSATGTGPQPGANYPYPPPPPDDFGSRFTDPAQLIPTPHPGSSAPTHSSGGGGLTDVNVSSRNVTITFWDHGSEDGDRITLYLNGQPLRSNIALTKSKQSFQVHLSSGANKFGVKALNEGSVSPNTASVQVSNVTSGRPIQVYSIKTGQQASMNLIAP